MTRQESLLQWTACVSSNMPELSISQARLLAWWSFGIAMTGACGRYTVATFLALLCRLKVANVEQRLYEWCLDAQDKAGRQRQEVALTTCQVALLLGGAVLTVVAALGGYALAARGLQPIDQMTRTARRISAAELSGAAGPARHRRRGGPAGCDLQRDVGPARRLVPA